MTKRLTREYTNHMQRVQDIENAIIASLPKDAIKLEILKSLHNVTLDVLHDLVNGTYRMYEDD